MLTVDDRKASKRLTSKILVTGLAALLLAIPGASLLALDVSLAAPGLCSQTTRAAFRACRNEVRDDYWIAIGKCSNLADAGQRAECQQDAQAELLEAKALCKDQRDARQELCADLGQGPYDPQPDPEQFVNFDDVVEDPGTFTPNPYFPLVPGTRWVYEARDDAGNLLEKITVTVTGDTKEIEYPAGSRKMFVCAVVTDVVEEWDPEEGEFTVIEDTVDWYAQEEGGNVWYFGEISLTFEDGELVGTEGSWKSGVEGAKPGILMWDYPQGPASEPPQEVYRQEFLLGDAEDVAQFVGFVALASLEVGCGESLQAACHENTQALQTKDFTPIEPDVFEYKYYAPGVGLILEEAYEDDEPTGERVELVTFTPGS